ncbi:unnamed protein product [Ilex paraguariensis]|uniref:EGF-like domain-containing protein n=1 Tax=Ilex paraguariensis TaxID=185542 RepID=A0ABC8SRB9_9AQUA
MFCIQKWKCSWSLVAGIVSIMALVSVVHIFLFPVVPPFDYCRATRQVQNSYVPINGSIKGGKENVSFNQSIGRSRDKALKKPQQVLDLDVQFPAELHNTVVYRGAPWKVEIGRWLSSCNSNTTAVKIVEKIGSKTCKSGCSGQGICNRELGEGCAERLQLTCNFPGSKVHPYGRWVISICPAYCDTTRAMCFCGEGTKYPNRPVAEACGFKVNLPSDPGGPALTDWTKADLDNIFTTNGTKPGWCNVDPLEAYASKVHYKKECDCKYDGLRGRFCEVPVLSTCINQCSGKGHCRGGFCQAECSQAN